MRAQSMRKFSCRLCDHAQVDWDDLRYVLALHRDRTLSRAAGRLGTTHTTVGRRLRAIEEVLGVRLFDPTPDGFVATAAGEDIAEVAERMETEVLQLEGRVLGRDAELRGKLRVATMDLLFRRYHGPIASFIARYPSVELTLATSDTEVSLPRREADVALRLTNTPPEYAVGRKIGRLEFAVYASQELAERIGPGAPLDAYPWLHWDERLNMRWLDEWLARNAPRARVAMRLDFTTTGLRDAIAAGIGVHFMACADCDSDPRFVRLAPVAPEFGRDVWLLTLPDLRHTARVRAFMDHLDETTKAERRTAAASAGSAGSDGGGRL